uniref:Vasoactive intestinal peptide n=1 Tax=Pseudonaja textilis TaxID=8673 RepID=A0A670Z826_PSETE
DSKSHIVAVLFGIFLCESTAWFPSAFRLGNRIPFDGQSESDHTQSSLKPEADGVLQTALPENEKFYFDMSRAIDSPCKVMLINSLMLSALSCLKQRLFNKENNNPLDEQVPVKRHSDAVFTDNYSRLRQQMAVKKYLDSVLTGKRSQEDLNQPNLRDEVELLEPAFSENYDDVTVDDLSFLNRLPLVG